VYFDSLHALLGMDGHGMYVWTAYLVTLLTIGYLLIAPVRRRKRFLASLAATQKRVSGPPSGSNREDQ
jgi:heme exporter protein D